MTADEFVHWAMAQPDGERYELAGGEVFATGPQQSYHNRVKSRVFRRLEEAVEAAGRACEVFGDGMAVQVNDSTIYEPDAAIRSGALDKTATRYGDPLVVVEVLSPSTQALDTGLKFADYFSLSSVAHYLIIRLDTPTVIHHARTSDGIETRIFTTGLFRLAHPGSRWMSRRSFRKGLPCPSAGSVGERTFPITRRQLCVRA